MSPVEGASVLEAVRAILSAATRAATVARLADFAGRYGAREIYLGELGGLAGAFNCLMPNAGNGARAPDPQIPGYDETLALLRRDGVRFVLTARQPIRWKDFCARTGASAAGPASAADGLLFPAHAVDRPSGCISVGSWGETSFRFEGTEALEIVCQTAYTHLGSFGRVFPFRKVARRDGRWEVLGVPGTC